MNRTLDVFFQETLAGQLTQGVGGKLQFTYDANHLKNKGQPLSLSMPLREDPFDDAITRPFFSGLLPDDRARHKLAKYLGLSEKNPFSLLEAIGGECAGALSLVPKGERLPNPLPTNIQILDDQQLGEILDCLKRRPLLAGMKDIRLSLAGVQDKIAVNLVDNCIALVHGTTPTTHILKPPIEDVPHSVHNEFFCMNLAAKVGVDTPHTQLRFLGETPYLLIERYDRIHAGPMIHRLHQEDFCQALSIPPEQKYQREGGPSILQCVDILNRYALKPALDVTHFINRVIFNYLIGNADAHAKNFSLLYQGSTPSLSPAYDLISTAVYPFLSSKMAMKIGGKYDPNEVFLSHWLRLVPETKTAQHALEKQLKDMAGACYEQSLILCKSLSDSGLHTPIYEEIIKIIQRRAQHFSL